MERPPSYKERLVRLGVAHIQGVCARSKAMSGDAVYFLLCWIRYALSAEGSATLNSTVVGRPVTGWEEEKD